MRCEHTVQVTSFGGSGSTALYRHLEALGCQVPSGFDDWGPFKHQRRPPLRAEVGEDFRVVYLFSDPRDAAISVFARGFQWEHYRRMHGHREGWPGRYPKELSDLDTFLRGGRDLFNFSDHLSGWLAAEVPVMFVRQDQLATSWQQIADYLGLPGTAPKFGFIARSSRFEDLDSVMVQRISEVYSEAVRLVETLPPVFER